MKKGKHFICPNCHKAFFRKFRNIKKGAKFSRFQFIYCSRKCHYEHVFTMTIQKLSNVHSEPLKKIICRWYIADKISMREITKKLQINYRTTQKLFKYFKILQRSAHDRIALQWENNEQRRKEQSKRTSDLLRGKPSWKKGLNKETHPGIKRQAEWMTGSNNPMYGKKGKLHHQYKNGQYTSDKKRYWGTSEYRQWRKAVFKRDNYACQECGFNKGRIFNAHHIKSVKDYPELIFNVSNGILLCEMCHHLIHSSIQAEIEQRP